MRDAGELGRDRREALRVDGFLIHTGGVVITDLLRDGIAAGRGLGGLFEDLMEDLEIALLQFVEAAPFGLVWRDGILLHPRAAGVLVEIDARIGGPIDGAKIELNGRRVLPRGGLREQGAEEERRNECNSEQG